MTATLHERIAEARRRLAQAGLDPRDASIDAEVLARHVLGWDRAALLARGREPAPPAFAERFASAIVRREAREPVALITGHREFWGLEFEVTPDVLIPRPESELIVEAALEEGAAACRRIVDVGTGSGCLAVALATVSAARVTATDMSAAALGVARRNAQRHGVKDRISFVRADLLEGLAGSVDLIVSNPPYVPVHDDLPPDVARYEPPSALYAGADGLEALRRLIATAAPRLAGRGRLIVEFGFGQAASIRRLAEGAGWRQVDLRSDLQGIPRVAVMG